MASHRFPMHTLLFFFPGVGVSFNEALMVRGVGEQPLQFQFSDPTDLEVIGADELKENPVMLPPYLTLGSILQPE